MSRTIRKDKNDKKYPDGRLTEDVFYRCNCFYCTGGSKYERNLIKNKIARIEMLEEIINLGE